jgi:hypothetical protein
MFSLVGNRHGRKVIRWGYVISAGLLISLIAGPAAAGLYAALTKSWNPLVLLLGPIVGLAATLLTLGAALRTPLQRLPLIK